MWRRGFSTFFCLVLIVLFTACGNDESAGLPEVSNQEETGDETGEVVDRSASSGEAKLLSKSDSAGSAPAVQPYQPPNGAEYDAMYFKHYGTNPFVATEEDPLSTFAVDVDTGSYSVMRRYIERGALPPEEAVRVEEFINYFDVPYEPPVERTFALHVQTGNAPFAEGYQLVRIGLKGKELEKQDRQRANLVFVIDVSGSMDRENRLGLVKKSLHLLLDQLKPDDQVGIVIYGSKGKTLLEPTPVEERETIRHAIDRLHPGGSTNAEEGLTIGYRLARESFVEGAINRVILCSDGVANVGETGHRGILDHIREQAGEGITLTTLGFGMGNYNDVLMERLANNGNGNYAYIDRYSEARRVLMEKLTGTLQTIAKDTKVQVEFDPDVVDRYRLLGYENRDIKDEDFNNDNVDAGEVGAGHQVTALYEVKVKGAPKEPVRLGEVRLRYRDVETNAVEELQASIRSGGELDGDTQMMAAVAEFAEILRGSYWAKDGSLEAVLAHARSHANSEQEWEFVNLVESALSLQGTREE